MIPHREWTTNVEIERLALSGLSSEFVAIQSIVQGLGFEYPGPYAPRIRRALEQASVKGFAKRSPTRLPAAWCITVAGRHMLASINESDEVPR